MTRDNAKTLWVVVLAHSGIPVKVRVFREYAQARRCQNRWEKAASEEYDAVGLFESSVNQLMCTCRQ